MKGIITTAFATMTVFCTYSQTGSLISSDSQAENPTPIDRNSGVYADFKENITDGLGAGNIYHSVIPGVRSGNSGEIDHLIPGQADHLIPEETDQ